MGQGASAASSNVRLFAEIDSGDTSATPSAHASYSALSTTKGGNRSLSVPTSHGASSSSRSVHYDVSGDEQSVSDENDEVMSMAPNMLKQSMSAGTIPDLSMGLMGRPAVNGKVHVAINDEEYELEADQSILSACRSVGVHIPSLCFHSRLNPIGKCKTCAAEVEGIDGRRVNVCTCVSKIEDGQRIYTDSISIRKSLIDSAYKLLHRRIERPKHLEVDVHETLAPEMASLLISVDTACIDGNHAIEIDTRHCVECSRCVTACRDFSGTNVLSIPPGSHGTAIPVETEYGLRLKDTNCVSCGQCSLFCPSNAIRIKTQVDEMQALLDSDMITVATVAPAVRYSLGEEFGFAPGHDFTEALNAVCRQLGFNYVFDIQFAADLTIVEEGTELLDRIENDGPLPMFTSCCPAWVNAAEKSMPEVLPHLSTCKSPMAMMGAVVKGYWAEKKKLNRKKVKVVGIMPCTAKKDEATRKGIRKDVDLVITTRELGQYMRERGWDHDKLSHVTPEPFDDPLGTSTGAATLFPVAGGVTEAALRTVYEVATGKPCPTIDFTSLRGGERDNVRKAVVDLPDGKVRVQCIQPLAAARRIIPTIFSALEERDMDSMPAHFIEVMACPGGCIGGGGQPKSVDTDIIKTRTMAVLNKDDSAEVRRSHENPAIIKLYGDTDLEEFGSHAAHHLLHTSYTNRAERAVYMNAVNAAKHSADRDVHGPTSTASSETNTRRGRDELFRQVTTSAEGSCDVLILYATQTGNAERVARVIERYMKKKELRVGISSIDMYDPTRLSTEQKVVFITSTFWSGDFPEMAAGMWSFISMSSHPSDLLSGMKYSVFGLGNSTFEHFNNAGKLLDKRLFKLGGQRITRLGEGDFEASKGYETALEPWLRNVGRAIAK